MNFLLNVYPYVNATVFTINLSYGILSKWTFNKCWSCDDSSLQFIYISEPSRDCPDIITVDKSNSKIHYNFNVFCIYLNAVIFYERILVTM
jgi:hypothetical protein